MANVPSCRQFAAEGHEDLLQLMQEELKESKSSQSLFILFTGKEDPSTGQSWCPDCSVADPVIEKALFEASADAVFIFCVVGDRPTWKDPKNEFRVDPDFALTSIPTLMKLEYNGTKFSQKRKLQEAECANLDLVTMLFQDD